MLNLPIIIGSIIVFALTLLLWPIAALTRKHYRSTLELSPERKRIWFWVRIVCALDLVFAIAFPALFVVATKDISMLSERLHPWIRIVQLVGWLGVLGTVVVLINLAGSWTDPRRSIWSKLGDALIALACLGFVFFVFNWNMLHWSLNF
ncbi:MAG: hypothetical protein JOY93_08560 [Acidobacteriales bacterium]|nr:hypothetical protein [Terriglobales bacterium]